MIIDRKAFYDPEMVVAEVKKKITLSREKDEQIDYLTFVPDGEPTLDMNLGVMADMLKNTEIPLATISNGSLIWMEDVQADLHKLDWVSLKTDSVVKEAWKNVDRPHGKLDLKRILDGYLEFAEKYKGKLNTETMLVKGVNDSEYSLNETAAFLADMKPDVAYISIPTRPPAEKKVFPADEETLNRAFHIFSEKLKKVELLFGYEGNEFAATGNAAEDILSITAVHPMRADAVEELLKNAGEGWGIVKQLVAEGKLLELPYREKVFYLRSMKKAQSI
jgi:wyosine [tRNA(Phe)-imidazoG37] synthetase (radical SAM superfamily)